MIQLSNKYKKYENYKSTLIPWIDKMPAHWKLDRIKWSIESSKNGVWGDNPNGENDIVCIRVADFNRINQKVELINPTFRSFKPSDLNGRKLEKYDLLIEKSGGGENQLVGQVVEFDLGIEAVCSNFIARLKISSNQFPRYWSYFNQFLYSIRRNFVSIKQTTGIQNLDFDNYINEIAFYPTLNEQKHIANFLDIKTSHIDALIQQKRLLIKLLEDKRIVIITNAVTKGLNHNVKMNNSGIKWIGNIPEHWEVKKLKFLTCFIGSGKTPKGGSDVYVNDGILLFRSQNIYDFELKIDDAVYIDDEIELTQLNNTKTKDFDILLNITGASIGRCNFIPKGFPRANVNQHVCIIRPLHESVYYKYLHYSLISSHCKAQIESLENGSSREGLNFKQVGDMKICVPSIDEQKYISDFLEKKLFNIKRSIDNIYNSIDRLKEYRDSLITSAVTGKIDVRDGVDS